MNLDAIKPDGSGKFSPLLHKWLTSKRSRMLKNEQIFQTRNMWDGVGYSDHWRMNEIVIGYAHDGGVSGRSLGSILRGGRGVQSSSYFYGHEFGLREITDEFWVEYQRIGRCVWDTNHQICHIGDEGRYLVSPDGMERHCNWCGLDFAAREMSEVLRWIEWYAKEAV